MPPFTNLYGVTMAIADKWKHASLRLDTNCSKQKLKRIYAKVFWVLKKEINEIKKGYYKRNSSNLWVKGVTFWRYCGAMSMGVKQEKLVYQQIW